MGGCDVGAACETEHARIRQRLARRLSSAEPEMSHGRASRGMQVRAQADLEGEAGGAVADPALAEGGDGGFGHVRHRRALGARITARYRTLPDGEEERGCNASARRVAACLPPLSSPHVLSSSVALAMFSPSGVQSPDLIAFFTAQDNAAVSTWRRTSAWEIQSCAAGNSR
jgi:hypothetical protein